MNRSRSGVRRSTLHPVVTVLLTVPALVAVLIAGPPGFATAAVVVCLPCGFLRGFRVGGLVTVSAVALFAILWWGMGLWLPRDAATSGALRVVALSLLMVPLLFVNAAELADTLIDRFRVPYRLLDAVMLGGRFATLMRQDLRVACGLTSLRTSGSPRRWVGLRARAALAVLIASFRHSEHLGLAMDARGFGMYRERTVRHSRPITRVDVGVLAAVWSASIVLAVLFERG